MRVVLLALIAIAALASRSDAETRYEFTGPELDETIWCACQANADHGEYSIERLKGESSNDGFVRFTARTSSLGGNNCLVNRECKMQDKARILAQDDAGEMRL